MKRNILILIFLFSLLVCANTQTSVGSIHHSGIIFPSPFAIAIDDIGWNVGKNDGHNTPGPYRIGLKRDMELADYKCLVDVAKRVGVRFQGLFIMGEMDRNNILAQYPTTNEHGSDWDNRNNISDKQIEIMQFVQDNAAWLEFGLHGVGHEYWPVAQQRKRAEWYNTDDNHEWEESEIDAHIECFQKLMGQYGLTEENGHSFPESFVPCAYGYHWNPQGDYSTGAKLGKVGVKYANTLFFYVEELNPPKGDNAGAVDHGVLVVNRINYGNPWYKLSSLPTVPLSDQKSNMIETHWTNWLVQDEFLQDDLNQKWVDYYNMVSLTEDRYTAKNTEQFYAQWLYQKYTSIEEEIVGLVSIDNRLMPDEMYSNNLLGTLVLKVKLKDGQHIKKASLGEKSINVYHEESGYGILYVPSLEKKKYTLKYEVSNSKMDYYLNNTGTYNVYDFENKGKRGSLSLRMYGTQEISIVGISKQPIHLKCNNDQLVIKEQKYNKETRTWSITLQAHDIQGETGELSWGY